MKPCPASDREGIMSATSFTDSVATEIAQNQVEKIIVDTFGYGSSEVSFIQTQVKNLRSTTSILIEIQ